MQELKPVAFLSHDSITGKDFYVSAEANYGVGRTPLYAIPATHRIVPVELLEDLHRLCTEQAWWTIYREKAQKLQAIIDKEPT